MSMKSLYKVINYKSKDSMKNRDLRYSRVWLLLGKTSRPFYWHPIIMIVLYHKGTMFLNGIQK